jgi:L-ascorbate metabolism protein UlaG (beta-lactamase superfamily)
MKKSLSFLLFAFLLTGCSTTFNRMISRAIGRAVASPDPAPMKSKIPVVNDAKLSVTWVGHSTMLIRIHDKIILTDPVFTKTVGMVVTRYFEPGLDPSKLTSVDFTLISHSHVDHFSFGSLDMIPKNGKLLLPSGAAVYSPDFSFAETREMKPWEVLEEDGVRITAVPVQHFGGRYGIDFFWSRDRGYTGWVVEYKGTTIFIGGDTGYHPEYFKEIGRRFSIDLAIVPIAPVEPRDFMRYSHVDPNEALQIFADVNAKLLIPMHYGTFVQGIDPYPMIAREILQKLVNERGLKERVRIPEIGERVVVLE